MAFSLRLLRVFLAVARHRSFTRAAGELGLTQPAVSRAVRELESQTRATLLDRTPAGVRLTEAGSALLTHARVIFAETRAAEEDLDALAGLAQGTLRIGASPTIATYVVPPMLHAYHTRYPGVELRLVTAPSRVVARLLFEREVDIALVETPVDDDRLSARVWAEDTLVIVAAPTHTLAGRSDLTPAAIAQELFVIREPGSGTHRLVLRALRSHGVVPHRRLEVDSTEAITQIVAAGLGTAIVSRCAAADPLALGRLVILDVPGLAIRRPFTRLALAGVEISAAATAFESMIVAPLRATSGARTKARGARNAGRVLGRRS